MMPWNGDFPIDLSNRSLKAVLLNNGNNFPSIPVEHSVEIKEPDNSMQHLRSTVNYQEHEVLICRDL